MISKTPLGPGSQFDIILVTAEFYDDHPLSPVGVIARVLDAKGYSVGILEKPVTKADYQSMGVPKLFFGVTSGSIDSMLNNYTPLKKPRVDDKFNKAHEMPDRAVIFYCNRLREYFKEEIKNEKTRPRIVIGGIESSLRRFAHYDYWDNDIRKSILMDSRADILVYGNGEKQVIEIAEKTKQHKQEVEDEVPFEKGFENHFLKGILGTTILSKELPSGFELLPKYSAVRDHKLKFAKMQTQFSNEKNLAQEYDNNYILQYKSPEYTTADLDWLYSLPFTRKQNPDSLLKMAKFSVQTHRGCLGNCNFCSITLHQGKKIISRSEKSILDEIERITKMKDFNGIIDDLGGPSANMYAMDFDKEGKIDLTHKKLIHLMKASREVPGVKKVFVRSGIRYDFAMNSREYIEELSAHHISGCLKIAPEHITESVLELMNKNTKKLQGFIDCFTAINKDKKQYLAYYFMIAHPGDDVDEVRRLQRRMKSLDAESFQLFTPTPMTMSTAMYWTSTNPNTMQPIKVVYDYATKKKMKDILMKENQGYEPASQKGDGRGLNYKRMNGRTSSREDKPARYGDKRSPRSKISKESNESYSRRPIPKEREDLPIRYTPKSKSSEKEYTKKPTRYSKKEKY